METDDEFKRRVGTVEVGVPFDFRSHWQVTRDFLLAIFLLVGFCALTVWLAWPSLKAICIVLPAFGVYCTVAYFVRARPNHDELGLGGGFANQRFRLSDDVNRSLLRLALFLAFGRFISFGLVDGVRLIRRGQLPQDRLLQDLDD